MLLCFFLLFYGVLFIRSKFSWRYVRFSSVVKGILLTVAIVAIVAAITSILYFTHPTYFTHPAYSIERAISTININAPGNHGRIQSWMQGLSLWWHGNIFFGEHTGLITNSVRNILHEKSFVVESSFIQQLCNFGLIGAVIFYAAMLYNVLHINRECIVLIATGLSIICQTLIVQSIEFFPYMAFFSLLPVISRLFVKPAVAEP